MSDQPKPWEVPISYNEAPAVPASPEDVPAPPRQFDRSATKPDLSKRDVPDAPPEIVREFGVDGDAPAEPDADEFYNDADDETEA